MNRLKVTVHFYGGLMAGISSKFATGVLLASIALMTAPVEAQRSHGLSPDLPDSRTLRVQRKVDELYERGEFDRAYFIYRNELVPIGDKYAQYMVGYMHLVGRGTDEDRVAASAWYRLAAERGTPEFVAVRNQLMHDLNADERRRSDDYYLGLRRQFSDLVVLLEVIKRKHRELQPSTGSRLARSSSPITVIDPKSANHPQSGAVYYGRIEREMERKLLMLAEIGDFPDLETDPARVNIRDVERLVNERIGSIPD
ncbi:MAG: hypothetical protein KJO01_05040 [Gammaproteobacteria bacterium]|nr:hypothetical protein [Gammaproteobacteria bacterium]MBT8110665.1 hypothetical protein [Gammaproteobacteria bacterium]NND47895.1 SEL1-like repeat protein [Woeseiaceae bacterium]NNL45364.1 SEL1-like repeat protein [Woeseiaceae bacterium]